MNVLCRYASPISAIVTYRQFVPLGWLAENDHIRLVQDDINRAADEKDRVNVVKLADIIQMHAGMVAAAFTVEDIQRMQLAPPIMVADWTLKYPPALVLDIDDLFTHIPPTNGPFHHWGIRGPNEELLKPGDAISARGADGKIYVQWEDGVVPENDGPSQDPFDIARNFENQARLTDLCKVARGFTVTTNRLKETLEAELGREIFVMPNCIQRIDYPEVELGTHDGKIRIMWQGGSSHFEDLSVMMEPLAEVLKKYPHAEFVWWGQDYPGARAVLPEGQVRNESWVPHEAYHARLATINHDINWIPVTDNTFNRHKSACKWYESSAIHKPAATIAAAVGPYADEIIDGETGLLYNDPIEFAQKLSTLIENATLRKGLAEAAHRWVWANRDVSLWAPKLLKYYEEVLDEHYSKVDSIHAFV